MEQSDVVPAFSWFSPLGGSVALFLLSGLLHVLIGSLTPFMLDSSLGRSIIFISARTDTELFGKSPAEILETNPEMVQLRSVLKGVMGGWLTVIGVFMLTVTWYGLRARAQWALMVLVLTGVIIIGFWYVTFRPYLDAGISFRLSDVPPIFWIPAVTLIPAAVLGWIGVR